MEGEDVDGQPRSEVSRALSRRSIGASRRRPHTAAADTSIQEARARRRPSPRVDPEEGDSLPRPGSRFARRQHPTLHSRSEKSVGRVRTDGKRPRHQSPPFQQVQSAIAVRWHGRIPTVHGDVGTRLVRQSISPRPRPAAAAASASTSLEVRRDLVFVWPVSRLLVCRLHSVTLVNMLGKRLLRSVCAPSTAHHRRVRPDRILRCRSCARR